MVSSRLNKKCFFSKMYFLKFYACLKISYEKFSYDKNHTFHDKYLQLSFTLSFKAFVGKIGLFCNTFCLYRVNNDYIKEIELQHFSMFSWLLSFALNWSFYMKTHFFMSSWSANMLNIEENIQPVLQSIHSGCCGHYALQWFE